jgi:hypothetical protein
MYAKTSTRWHVTSASAPRFTAKGTIEAKRSRAAIGASRWWSDHEMNRSVMASTVPKQKRLASATPSFA